MEKPINKFLAVPALMGGVESEPFLYELNSFVDHGSFDFGLHFHCKDNNIIINKIGIISNQN